MTVLFKVDESVKQQRYRGQMSIIICFKSAIEWKNSRPYSETRTGHTGRLSGNCSRVDFSMGAKVQCSILDNSSYIEKN